MSDVNLVKVSQILDKGRQGQTVGPDELAGAGIQQAHLKTAETLGMNWVSLLALVAKYGPLVLQIIPDLVAGRQITPPKTLNSSAPAPKGADLSKENEIVQKEPDPKGPAPVHPGPVHPVLPTKP